MAWPDVAYCTKSLRGKVHKPHDHSDRRWCNGEAAPGIHDWSGPTVGDRECVRCGMSPRDWLGEPCVSPLVTVPPGKLAVCS